MPEKMIVSIKKNCPQIEYSLKKEHGSVFLMAENINDGNGTYYILELREEGDAVRCSYINKSIGLQLDNEQRIVVK